MGKSSGRELIEFRYARMPRSRPATGVSHGNDDCFRLANEVYHTVLEAIEEGVSDFETG
jgi:hypothetical protein